jgi:hypothetical protein
VCGVVTWRRIAASGLIQRSESKASGGSECLIADVFVNVLRSSSFYLGG